MLNEDYEVMLCEIFGYIVVSFFFFGIKFWIGGMVLVKVFRWFVRLNWKLGWCIYFEELDMILMRCRKCSSSSNGKDKLKFGRIKKCVGDVFFLMLIINI